MSIPHTHYQMVIPPKNTQGIVDSFEFAVHFLAWCNGECPSARCIADHFGVSRATAYRYRAAYHIWVEKQWFETSPRRLRILATLGV